MSFNILPITDGYLLQGTYNWLDENTETQRSFYIAKLNKKGEYEWLKHIDEGFEINGSVTGNLLIETAWNDILVGYNNYKNYGVDNTQKIKLVRLSKSGEILWQKEYSDLGASQGPSQILTLDDGSIIIVGVIRYEGEQYSRMLLMKTSLFGQVEWLKTYGLAKTSRGFTVQQTTDGGFILGGDAIDEFDNHDMYIVKTDSQGNQQWDKRLGSEETDCAAFANILPDNTYLINGCITNAQGNHKLYLAKLDTNGGLIWEKTYNNLPTYQAFEDLCILEDGGFMATAFKFGTSGTTTELMRFDSGGKILWQKGLHLNEGKDCYLKDIDATPDGGYVLCGFQYTSPQYSWVVKIDSLGNTCSYTGCDSTYTYISEVTPGVGDEPVVVSKFRVYPNPASEEIHIQSPTFIQHITLYNLQGKKFPSLQGGVSEGRGGQTSQASLNISHLPKGIYLLQVVTVEGKYYHQKILKE
ncbi:MAG: T9SS type A sorting domain-containing protein [Chitinophagales bacterium]